MKPLHVAIGALLAMGAVAWVHDLVSPSESSTAKLARVRPDRIQNAVEALRDPPQKTGTRIVPPASWPPVMNELGAEEVAVGEDGVFIQMDRSWGWKYGYYVAFRHTAPPPVWGDQIRYRHLADPGIYWYRHRPFLSEWDDDD